MALSRDAVLRACARFACGSIRVWTFTCDARGTARSTRTNHIIALLALHPELRIRRARAVHTSVALCVRLLAGGTRCTGLAIGTHHIGCRTVLALSRDAVLRARARFACGSIRVWTFTCTTRYAICCSVTWCVCHQCTFTNGTLGTPGSSGESRRALYTLGLELRSSFTRSAQHAEIPLCRSDSSQPSRSCSSGVTYSTHS